MSRLLNLILLGKPQTVLEEIFCGELLVKSASGIITLIGIVIAAVLAYKFAIRKKKQEIFIGLEKIKYERKLAALETCWKLLAFTTDTENDNSILIWHQTKQGNEKTFFINVKNAKEFIKRLAEMFYGSGLGIYLSHDIKRLLYEYRGILYGFLLSIGSSEEKLIQVNKVQMHQLMVAIHQELIQKLKNETEIIDKQNGEK